MIDPDKALVEHHKTIEKMISTMSRKYDRLVPKDDIRQAAYEGLLKACNKFNPNKGTKFNTYLCIRIFGTVTDMIRSYRAFPRVAYKREQSTKFISTPIAVTCVVEFEYDRHDPATAETYTIETFEKLVSALPKKKWDRHIIILKMKYTLSMTFYDIGLILNISESRVCQLHTIVINELKTKHKVAASAA